MELRRIALMLSLGLLAEMGYGQLWGTLAAGPACAGEVTVGTNTCQTGAPALSVTQPLAGAVANQAYGIIAEGGDLSTNTGLLNTVGVWGKASNSSSQTYGLMGDAEINSSGPTSGANMFGGYVRSRLTSVPAGSTGNFNLTGLRSEVSTASGATTASTSGIYATVTTTGGICPSVSGVRTVVSTTGTTTNAYGVYGLTLGGGTVTNGYGVLGVSQFGTNRYAVYGDAGGYTGASAIWAGYFNGKAFCTLSAWSSDRRLKRDIEPLTANLDAIAKLKPSKYVFDHQLHPGLHLPDGQQLGLIAQDVEEVFPSLVENIHQPDQVDQDGKLLEPGFDFKGLNYIGFIPVLIGGMQEQQAIIADKQAQIDALNDRLTELEKRMNGTTAPSGSTSRNGSLEQNAPNPFNESTTIRFFVPDGSQQASIRVVNNEGKVWRTFERLANGNGQLVIAAGSMPAGSYAYSLVVDGITVAARTMVITR